MGVSGIDKIPQLPETQKSSNYTAEELFELDTSLKKLPLSEDSCICFAKILRRLYEHKICSCTYLQWRYNLADNKLANIVTSLQVLGLVQSQKGNLQLTSAGARFVDNITNLALE